MNRCPNCRRPVEDGDNICSYCESPLKEGQSKQGASQSQDVQQPSSERQSARMSGNEGQRQPQGSSNRSQAPPSEGGQPQTQSQSRRSTARGDESIIDALGRSKPQQYIRGIVAMMASLGFFLSVGILLVGNLGGQSLVPGILQGLEGVGGTQTGGTTVGDILSFTHELGLAYYANEISIFLAFMMAPIGSFLIILNMDDTPTAKIGTAAAGVGIGTLIFMFLVVTTASLVVPDAGDLGPQFSEDLSEDVTDTVVSSIDLGSVDFGNLLINSILIALATASASGAVVYFNERFFT